MTSPTDTLCFENADALEAYALGALDSDERQVVEAHLDRCASCRATVNRYDGVLSTLAGAVAPVAPPPGLRASLLAEIEQGSTGREPSANAAPPSVHQVQRNQPRGIYLARPVAIGLGVAASLLLVSLALTAVLLARTQAERNEAETAQWQLEAYFQEVGDYIRDGGVISPMTPMTADVESLGGSLIVAPNQPGGMVIVSGLPVREAGTYYRVWVARDDDRTPLDSLYVTTDGFGWLTITSPEPLVTYETIGVTLVTPATDERRDLLVAEIPSEQVHLGTQTG